jgi:Domain of unknown function (DUF4266)
MKQLKISLLALFMCFISQSCVSLKPYQQVFVKDPEMQMGADTGKNFQNYVHSIREGATPASSSKSSGGCGCN